MSDPTAFVLHDCCYYHPDCCPSPEGADPPDALYDEDLARFKGDIYCEACYQVINAHLTDYNEMLALGS